MVFRIQLLMRFGLLTSPAYIFPSRFNIFMVQFCNVSIFLLNYFLITLLNLSKNISNVKSDYRDWGGLNEFLIVVYLFRLIFRGKWWKRTNILRERLSPNIDMNDSYFYEQPRILLISIALRGRLIHFRKLNIWGGLFNHRCRYTSSHTSSNPRYRYRCWYIIVLLTVVLLVVFRPRDSRVTNSLDRSKKATSKETSKEVMKLKSPSLFFLFIWKFERFLFDIYRYRQTGQFITTRWRWKDWTIIN